MTDWHNSPHAEEHITGSGWNERKMLHAHTKVAPFRMTEDLKSTVYISRCYRSSCDWQRLPRCQFHIPRTSIPLKKSAPSNFRRHWIKSLSAVEVRQRLVWGSKTITSGQLTSSEPGEENWLAEELGQAGETGRGGLEDWGGPARGENKTVGREEDMVSQSVTYMKNE